MTLVEAQYIALQLARAYEIFSSAFLFAAGTAPSRASPLTLDPRSAIILKIRAVAV
jgi:hypothetical protein